MECLAQNDWLTVGRGSLLRELNRAGSHCQVQIAIVLGRSGMFANGKRIRK